MNFLFLNNHSCAEKISHHIIIAQKHNKNKDLEKYYKERAENEFEYLKDIIDDNRFNHARLLISKDIKYLCFLDSYSLSLLFHINSRSS